MSIHFSSKTPEWSTPQDLFDSLNEEFHFTLDPACTKENAKCKKFYTEKENGLLQDWKGERVFCNPPYGRVIGEWVKKMDEGGGFFISRPLTRPDRHEMVSRPYPQQSTDSLYPRAPQIRWLQKFCSVS